MVVVDCVISGYSGMVVVDKTDHRDFLELLPFPSLRLPSFLLFLRKDDHLFLFVFNFSARHRLSPSGKVGKN